MRLVAVSKTKPISLIEEAIEAGQIPSGKTRFRKCGIKMEVLPDNIKWQYDWSSAAKQGKIYRRKG